MHSLYLIFGDHYPNYLQAYASIISFKANAKNLKTINVVTDNPSWFEPFKDDINIILISPEQLQEWKGKHNYLWRPKIKAIQMLCERYPNEPVIYTDADTFMYRDDASMLRSLANNKAVMHLNEGAIKNGWSKTVNKMHQRISQLSDAPIAGLENYDMWNAGVVATPNTKNGAEFELALATCDYLCEHKVPIFYIEQFSLSAALKDTYGLEEAQEVIAHYWSNKEEWNQYWNEYLLSRVFKGVSFSEMVSSFNQQDFSKMPPTMRITKNTQKRLINWVKKKFPDKKVVYLNK